jgi:hypothetical protein
MIAKYLAAALLVAPVPVAPAIPESAVEKVTCIPGVGSAFRIGKNTFVSVKHVTSLGGCVIDGKPIEVVYTHPTKDFSIIKADSPGPTLRIDCGGFVANRKYSARGYARGIAEISIELVGTGKERAGLSILWGIFTVIPGQSGGAVIDDLTGKVVGTINAYDAPQGYSGSVELRGTPLCAK